MLGCCNDEGSMFAEIGGLAKSQRAVDKFMTLFGKAKQHILAIYSGIDDVASYYGSIIDHPSSKMFHDAVFEAPVRFLAETLSTTPNAKTGKIPAVYLYHSEAVLPTWETFGWGVHHFAEIPFVFNTSSFWKDEPNDPAAKTALNFGRRWIDFAFSGTPGPGWPKYTSSERTRYVFLNRGGSKLEDVSDGTSEIGILLFTEVIKARWGIRRVSP